jgi:hypothetical protein
MTVSTPSCRTTRIVTRLRENTSPSRSRIGPSKPLLIVLRAPGLLLAAVVVHDRRVHDDGRGREAVLERRRVQERLEAGARLAPRLRHAVEFVVEVIEAADQRHDGAIIGIQRHQRALRLGQLRQLRHARGHW